MKDYKLLVACLGLLVSSVTVSAQTYLIALDGTINQSSNAYANVGDTFNATFTLRGPVEGPGAPGTYYQATSSAAGDDTFQDVTTTGTHTTTTGESATSPDNAANVVIFSGYEGYGHPPTAIYGYQFDSGQAAPATYDPGYEFWEITFDLESTDSAVAPTGSLSDIQAFPIGDFNFVNSFNLVLEQATYSGTNFTGYVPVASETGVLNSYSVTATAGPEPSSWILFSGGLLIAGIVYRAKRLAKAA